MCMHAYIWGLHSRFDWWEFCCFDVLAKTWSGVLGGSLGCAPHQAMTLIPHFAPGGLLEHGILGSPVDGDLWGSGAARRLPL